MTKMTWEDWCKRLIEIAGDFYGPGGPIEQCGEDAWRDYYDEGYTPDDAWAEDIGAFP